MGGRAVHIPYETTWEHEVVPEEELAGRDFIRLTNIRELLALIERLKETTPSGEKRERIRNKRK
jgi:putative hydrolase of the HAD superfamily